MADPGSLYPDLDGKDPRTKEGAQGSAEQHMKYMPPFVGILNLEPLETGHDFVFV